jgi:hypothetical protein
VKAVHTLWGWLAAIVPVLAPVAVPAAHALIVAHPALGVVAAFVSAAGASVAAVGPGADAPAHKRRRR